MTDENGLIVNSFQCESIFQKENCHHTIFSLDVSKFQIPSLSASAERSQISQDNGTNNVNCKAEWDHQLTLRTRIKVWQQFLLVTSSKPACRCLLLPLLHVKRWKRGTFLHATKEIKEMWTQAIYLGNWSWRVKFSWIKDNIPIIYISSFRHFLVKN